jgi:hypothetical protein
LVEDVRLRSIARDLGGFDVFLVRPFTSLLQSIRFRSIRRDLSHVDLLFERIGGGESSATPGGFRNTRIAVGASITTPDSLLLGFGLEGVSGASSRAAVMGRAIEHLQD